jgi:hypothetical protein
VESHSGGDFTATGAIATAFPIAVLAALDCCEFGRGSPPKPLTEGQAGRHSRDEAPGLVFASMCWTTSGRQAGSLSEQGDDQQRKQRQQEQNALGLLKSLHAHNVLSGKKPGAIESRCNVDLSLRR